MSPLGSAYPDLTVKPLAPGSRAFSALLLPIFFRSLAAMSSSLLLLVPLPAHAEGGIFVALDFATDPALPDCPSAADFRRDVVRQLGRDPFRDDAPRRLVVRLTASGARTAGRVEWRDAHDEWEGERTFSSRSDSCVQMSRAMALATAIQIQLLARLGVSPPGKPVAEPPAPPPETQPPDVPAAVATTAPPAPAPKEPALAVGVGAGVIGDLGAGPAFVLPRLAVALGRPSAFAGRLTVSGFGPSADVSRPDGVATIDRFLMTLELVRFFRYGRIVQPLLAAGLGWQDIRAHGTSAMRSLGAPHDGQVFTGVLTASGGLAFAVAARVALVVEAQALLFRPAVNVDVGTAQAAHLEGASLFAHGGLLARF
jgi:hypothetical protein